MSVGSSGCELSWPEDHFVQAVAGIGMIIEREIATDDERSVSSPNHLLGLCRSVQHACFSHNTPVIERTSKKR